MDQGEDRRAVPRPFHFGTDEVTLSGGRLEVKTARPMEEWEPGQHRPSYVRFRGACYRIEGVERDPDGRVRYRLAAADPESSLAIPGQLIDYDEDYVRDRDQGLRAKQLGTMQGYGLWLILPLLGFLPSAPKARLHERFGFHPQTTTELSIYVEAVYLIVLSVISLFQLPLLLLPSGLFATLWIVALPLLLDLVVRRARTQVPSLRQYGLFEWLFRRFRDGE